MASKKKEDESELATVQLDNQWLTWLLTVGTTLIAIAFILMVLVFAITSQAFGIGSRQLDGFLVSADEQLAILGLVNSVQNLLVTKALEDFGNGLVTIWMTRGLISKKQAASPQGARLGDFKLATELTKPISSLKGVFANLKVRAGWKTFLRCVLTVAVSICVLLQGLAINTLGMPKRRWYPDDDSMSVVHPQMVWQDNGLVWDTNWNSAFGLVGGGGVSWNTADALLTSNLLSALAHLPTAMLDPHQGWQPFGVQLEYGPQLAALDTRVKGSSFRGLSVKADAVQYALDYVQRHGTKYAKASFGWTGNLTLVVPSVTAHCALVQSNTVTDAEGSVNTTHPTSNSNLFSMSFAPDPATDFAGASCSLSFERVYFPFHVWIIDGSSTTSLSVNHYGQQWNETAVPLPPNAVDLYAATQLGRTSAAVVARLETSVRELNAAQLFLALARNLRATRPDLTDDGVALAPVLAATMNYLVSIADWNVTYDSTEPYIRSSPMRFELYGSGPRLPWEWCTVAILAILLAVLLVGLLQSLFHRMVPGKWLEVGGMLVAANLSPRMERLKDNVNGAGKHASEMYFTVQESLTDSNVVVLAEKGGPLGGNCSLRRDNHEYRWASK